MGIFQKTVYRLGDHLQVLAYNPDDKLFLLDDNAMGFAFVCQPLSGGDESVAEHLRSLLKQSWPKDTLMQFTLFAGQNITHQIQALMRRRMSQTDQLLLNAIQERADYLTDATLKPIDAYSGIKVRDTLLVITIRLPMESMEPTTKEIEEYSDYRTQFESTLSSVGFAPRAMTNDLYVEVMSSILNQGPNASWRDRLPIEAETDKELKYQILDYDKAVEVKPDYIQIGDTLLKTLSVKRMPKVAYQGKAAWYLGDMMTGRHGIRDNCMINMTLQFPDQQSAKDKMSARRTWANNQAYGPLLKFVPVLAAKKHSYDALFKELEDGDLLVRTYLSVTVFAQDRERLVRASSEARNYWGVHQFQLMEDRFFMLPLFLNSLPFGADIKAIRETYRFKTMAISHALPLLPIYGDWKGTGSPEMCFVSRNGQLMNFDLFDSETNYNATVAAQSGSGKSFLTNYLITSYLSSGAQIWVIDVGRSYEKLCHAFNGDFIEFTEKSEICLNPFELVEQYSEEEDVLVGLVSAMAAPTQPLSDLQVAGLKRHLAKVWLEKGKSMLVDDIEQSLLSDEDEPVKNIGKQLYTFTSAGQYGKYFNGKNTVAFNNPFTVLELEELKGRKHLQQVVLLQLIYQIQQNMYLGDRDRRKIVIIDEAWSLLTEGDVAKFIEHGYRRFRKYGGSAITITQSVNDLYANPTGRAIAENSANTFLLGQKKEAINQIKKDERLPLSEGGYEFLKTVHTVKGQYSEIFMMTDRGSGVGRLTVDRYSLLLYSTAPEDVQAINNYVKQNFSTAEAIKAVINDRGARV